VADRAELTTDDHRVAELIEDAGHAAESDDFFRSRAFYDAEGVSHSLIVGGNGSDELALPLLVHEIGESGRRDAITPYGYPGATIRVDRSSPPEPSALDWSATGLVSIFVRDRIGGEPCFAGGTRRSAVQVHDPSQPRQIRTRFAEQIRQNERLGYNVEVLRGPDTTVEHRLSFHAVYTETMRGVEAAERYFFEPDYFKEILRFERSWLFLARSPERATAAGAIVVLSDEVLHYYLGGTADVHRPHSPFKNIIGSTMDLADELGLRLNLGGGVKPGDGLEDFKRGFSNTELPFVTHEIVCDPDAYGALSGNRAGARFFPAYRAPED
jgi:GNAT acetyltransferase-like protein